MLFVTKYPLHVEYSIKKKFASQIKAVQNLGYEVYYTAFDSDYFYLVHNEEKYKIKKIAFGKEKSYIHLKAFLDMYDTVLRVLKREKFAYAYIRSCPLTWLGYRMLQRFSKNGTKIVVEIPTYPAEREKIRSTFHKLSNIYTDFWWGHAEKYCDLFTLIGDRADSYHGRPAINIDNGIQVDEIPMCRHAHTDGEAFHMLALASMCNWHAYDRVIEGMAQLDVAQRKNVVLDLVGDGGDGSISKWKELAERLQVQDCVKFHGYLSGDELDQMINASSIGLGTLGLYRKSFSSASNLKTREYMARGLPFVYAGDDPGLDGNEPYALKIPNDDTAVDMNEVLTFIENVEARPRYQEEMRQHAQEKMSWERQFNKVFTTLG